jgi:hypothetical protein
MLKANRLARRPAGRKTYLVRRWTVEMRDGKAIRVLTVIGRALHSRNQLKKAIRTVQRRLPDAEGYVCRSYA